MRFFKVTVWNVCGSCVERVWMVCERHVYCYILVCWVIVAKSVETVMFSYIRYCYMNYTQSKMK